jgi:hypothetical protein
VIKKTRNFLWPCLLSGLLMRVLASTKEAAQEIIQVIEGLNTLGRT